jgi:DNA-binding NarL/FixJ family response regulator
MPKQTFRDLYEQFTPPQMTMADRERASVWFVESDQSSRNQLRAVLHGLGYFNSFEAPNHVAALKKLEDRKPTHVIFEAKRTNMPVDEFLEKIIETDQSIIALPSSSDPTLDDVFGLLTLGARGYIVKPFNAESIEEAIGLATKGESISDAILYARDRNEALASLIGSSLGQLATLMRQANQFESAAREVPKKVKALRRAVSMGKCFANGGEDALLDAIMEFCLERGEGPASRLGRLRKRIDAKKAARQAKLEALGKSADSTQQIEQTSDKGNEGATVNPPPPP